MIGQDQALAAVPQGGTHTLEYIADYRPFTRAFNAWGDRCHSPLVAMAARAPEAQQMVVVTDSAWGLTIVAPARDVDEQWSWDQWDIYRACSHPDRDYVNALYGGARGAPARAAADMVADVFVAAGARTLSF